ncbi:MAG TPA: penicillin acylase family protein, partial [Usitatibacter sp.]|nr:penicillin acylase family protein [Usitatibacter sp.]
MRRAALVAAACGVVVLILAAVAMAWLHRSLPQIDGEASVRGLAAPVDVLRDAEGVPHLLAQSENDGWFAMGYVHAQDRLWQMEFQRRVAQGRLAEFLGERAFETDRLMRTLGFARLAGRVIERLDPATRASLEAYCAGINAFLAADPVLPVEFQVFRMRPEPWKPADVMGWLFVMGWDLSSNWRLELTRLRFAAKIGGERTNEIVPPYPGDKPRPLPDFKALYAEVSPTAGALLALSPQTEMP